MPEPTATYGITDRTRKAAQLSCSAFSRAVNTLNEHHEAEAAAFDAAAAHVPEKVTGNPAHHAAAALLINQAEQLRVARGALLDELLVLRSSVVDVALEAQSLLPDGVPLQINAEADRLIPAAPELLSGIAPTIFDSVRLLGEVLRWSKQISAHYAAAAVGPCFSLPFLIEHPTPAAGELHRQLQDVRKHLEGFAGRVAVI